MHSGSTTQRERLASAGRGCLTPLVDQIAPRCQAAPPLLPHLKDAEQTFTPPGEGSFSFRSWSSGFFWD